MSQTAIQICNSALAKLGERTITAFTDGTKTSDLCNLRYPVIRNNLLRDHVWSFAKTFVNLSPEVDPSVVFPWTYQFILPSDVARILSVTVDDDEVPYEQVGASLHSDQTDLDLRYVKNFSGAADGFAFPDDFAEVVACMLAAELAIPITQQQTMRDTYLQMFAERLAHARFNGAVDRTAIQQQASSWVDAHDGFGTSDIDPRLRGLSGA